MNNICIASSKIRKDIYEEIRQTIFDKHSQGITIGSLAEEMGICREHLSRMLNDHCPMNVDQFFYLIVRLELHGLQL